MFVEAIMWLGHYTTIANFAPNNKFGMISTIMTDGQFTSCESFLASGNDAIFGIWILPFFHFIRIENGEVKSVIGIFVVVVGSNVIFVDVVTFGWLFLVLQRKSPTKHIFQKQHTKKRIEWFRCVYRYECSQKHPAHTYIIWSDESIHCSIWFLVHFIISIFLDLFAKNDWDRNVTMAHWIISIHIKIFTSIPYIVNLQLPFW